MRELKFRAWHKQEKKILLPSDNIGVVIFGFNIVIDKKYIMMQYIGLKDKNGKEIYEGDIFKYNHHKGYNFETFIGSIFRHDTLPKHITKPRNLFDADEIEVDVLPYLEVIGNIHENPELLKSNVL